MVSEHHKNTTASPWQVEQMPVSIPLLFFFWLNLDKALPPPDESFLMNMHTTIHMPLHKTMKQPTEEILHSVQKDIEHVRNFCVDQVCRHEHLLSVQVCVQE